MGSLPFPVGTLLRFLHKLNLAKLVRSSQEAHFRTTTVGVAWLGTHPATPQGLEGLHSTDKMMGILEGLALSWGGHSTLTPRSGLVLANWGWCPQSHGQGSQQPPT